MAATKITAAEALKSFKGSTVTVRVARPVKVKGADGATRDAFDVKEQPLAEGNILSAADCGDRVVVVTTDGKRYKAKK